jgi:hypothetical protein
VLARPHPAARGDERGADLWQSASASRAPSPVLARAHGEHLRGRGDAKAGDLLGALAVDLGEQRPALARRRSADPDEPAQVSRASARLGSA